MAVGIYGYSAYNKFTIEVYQLPDSENMNYYDEDDNYKEPVDNGDSTMSEKKETRKTVSKVKKKLKNIPNGLWPFLELFEMLFLWFSSHNVPLYPVHFISTTYHKYNSPT